MGWTGCKALVQAGYRPTRRVGTRIAARRHPSHRHARNKSTAVRFRISTRVPRPWASTSPCPLLSPRTCSGVQNAPETGAFLPDLRLRRRWTPEQVRGDNRDRGAVCGRVAIRVPGVERSAGNPLVPRPHSQPTKVKPDSSGTSPGMTTKGGPEDVNRPTLSRPSAQSPQRPNRTAVDVFRAGRTGANPARPGS